MTKQREMLAAVLYGARDLRLESRPIPQPQPGQVLVQVRRAGVCGSDLHYYEHGYCGAFVPSQPFVLGHELVGTVAAMGEGVTTPIKGARVVVNPALSCGRCFFCRSGRINLCAQVVMLGSASTTPPTDGAFAQYVLVNADQCHPIPDSMEDATATLMEPLAVVLQAIHQAGSVAGKTVLISGGGPIGLLTLKATRALGATLIVVGDPVAERQNAASNMGADYTLDPLAAAYAAEVETLTSGGVDVVFEASGAPTAIQQAWRILRRGGTMVQIGTVSQNEVSVPANLIMIRELRYIGSFRYTSVFETALRLATSGRLDVSPLVTHTYSLPRLEEAMTTAAAKGAILKVQIDLLTT